MPAQNLAMAEQMMKVVYAEPIVNQIVRHSDCLQLFKKKAKVKHGRQGRYIEVSNLYVDPQGVGARGEQDYLPIATAPQAVNQKIYLKYLYFMVSMTKQVMVDMKKGPGAFVNWAEVHLTNVVKAFMNDADRQVIGTGAGIIARVNDGSPSRTDLGVDSAHGVAGLGDAAELFEKGAYYAFASDSKGVGRRSGTTNYAVVESYDIDDNTVTFKATPGTPTDMGDNDYIFRGDQAGFNAAGSNTARNKEVTGLLSHIDDGDIVSSYYGLTRNDEYDFLKSHIVDASASPYSGSLTEQLLLKLKDRIEKFSDGMPDTFLCSRGVWRAYLNELIDDRTYNDPRSYAGGADKLSIMLGGRSLTLMTGNRVPQGTAFLIDGSTLERGQTHAVDWADETGAIWKQFVDSVGVKDEYYAFGRWFFETFCNSPHKNGRIDGITEP